MSKNDSLTFESHEQSQRNTEVSGDSTLPENALVLESALENGSFEEGGCLIVCPGCGEDVERHSRGLPDPLVHFREYCEECEVALQRWAAVVLPSIQPAAVTTTQLQKIVTSYWERVFAEGVEDLGLPHTGEFDEATRELAEQFGWEWEITCPLCCRSSLDTPQSQLDYHHWTYNPDVGCSICQHCHDYLHGESGTHQANNQDWRAKQHGLRDFRDLAVIRLALRDKRVHDPDVDDYAERLQDRYNVPLKEARIQKLLSETRHRSSVHAVLMEHGGSVEPQPARY